MVLPVDEMRYKKNGASLKAIKIHTRRDLLSILQLLPLFAPSNGTNSRVLARQTPSVCLHIIKKSLRLPRINCKQNHFKPNEINTYIHAVSPSLGSHFTFHFFPFTFYAFLFRWMDSAVNPFASRFATKFYSAIKRFSKKLTASKIYRIIKRWSPNSNYPKLLLIGTLDQR